MRALTTDEAAGRTDAPAVPLLAVVRPPTGEALPTTLGSCSGAAQRVAAAEAYVGPGPLATTAQEAQAKAAAVAVVVPVPVATAVLRSAKATKRTMGATRGVRGERSEVAADELRSVPVIPGGVPAGVPTARALTGLGRPSEAAAARALVRPGAAPRAGLPKGRAAGVTAVLPAVLTPTAYLLWFW